MSERVAVITDIHANLPALQAALARIDDLGIDRIYCGGDLVGYGPHPDAVCALIAEREIPTIHGNYDHAIARDLEDCGCAYVTPHDRELGRRSVDWTLANTSAAAKAFMRELPFDLRFSVGSTAVHLVHGSPRKVNEYLFEDKPASTSALRRQSPPTCWCSATPTSHGCDHTAACCSSTAAQSASPRTAIRAARSPCSTPARMTCRSRSSVLPTTPMLSHPRSEPPGCRASSATGC
jgi:predicted phosphodiesterase